MFGKRKAPAIISYTSNPDLVAIKPDWKGTPLDEDGLFMNHEYAWRLECNNHLHFQRDKLLKYVRNKSQFPVRNIL